MPTEILIPDGQGSNPGGFGTHVATNVDDDPASNDGDTTFTSGPNKVDNASCFFTLSNTSAGFDPAAITSITIHVAHKNQSAGQSNGLDVVGGNYQVLKADEATALTSEHGETPASIAVHTEFAPAATQQGAPTKADWDGARLRFRQTYTAAGMADGTALVRLTAVRVIIEWSDAPPATDLVIQDGSHAHTAENLTLTEQAPAIDLVIQDGALGHGSGPSVLLGQEHNLAVQNAPHGHTAGVPSLTQAHNLTVSAGAHGHVADNLILTTESGAVTLVIQDSGHGHTAQNVALAQIHVLTVANAAHAHVAGNVALVHIHNLAVANAAHGHTAENVALGMPGALGIQDGTHGHTADSVALGQVHQLQIADSTHGHTSPTVTLLVPADLVIGDGTHAHLAGNVTLVAGDVGAPVPEAVAEVEPGATKAILIAAGATAAEWGEGGGTT